MATTTEFRIRQNTPTVVSGIATVDAGETTTLDIPCHGRAVVSIGVPTIDAGTLTFLVKPWPDGQDQNKAAITSTYRVLEDSSGNVVTVASSTGGKEVVIPELSGCYEYKIVCGAAQTSGAVEFEVAMVGANPTASGSNEVTIEGGTITANQGTKNAGAAASWYVQGTDASDAPVTGNPLRVGGRASAVQPTAVSANGDAVGLWLTRTGAVAMAGSGAINANTVSTTAVGLARPDNDTTVPLAVITAPWAFTRITTATTTAVKASAGVVHAVTVNATLTGTVTVYDNTAGSGTILAVLPIGAAAGTSFAYDAAMATGITVVTSAADDVTVMYR